MNLEFSINYEKEKRDYLIRYNHNRNIIIISMIIFILLANLDSIFIIASCVYWFFSYVFHRAYIKSIEDNISYLENKKRLDELNL